MKFSDPICLSYHQVCEYIRAVEIGGARGAVPPPPPNNLHKYAVLLITKVCHLKKKYLCPPICKKIYVCPPPQSVIASYGTVYSVLICYTCHQYDVDFEYIRTDLLYLSSVLMILIVNKNSALI